MARRRTAQAEALRRVRLERRRHRQVTALVGGYGLSYQRVADLLPGGPVSRVAVRAYAREVVELVGVDAPPREVLARLFLAHRDELEPLARQLDG